MIGALTSTVRQQKSSSVRFASSQFMMQQHHSPVASDVINDTDEEVDDEVKIEIETESLQKNHNLNEIVTGKRRIQTVKYKSKIWVQDTAGSRPNMYP